MWPLWSHEELIILRVGRLIANGQPLSMVSLLLLIPSSARKKWEIMQGPMLRFMCRTLRTAYEQGQPCSAQRLSMLWNSLLQECYFILSLRICIAIAPGSFPALYQASNASPDANSIPVLVFGP